MTIRDCKICSKQFDDSITHACPHCGRLPSTGVDGYALLPAEFIEWYLISLKKYATLKGRSRRKEFWCFVWVNILVNTTLCIFMVMAFLGLSVSRGYHFHHHNPSILELGIWLALFIIYSLTMLIPVISATVRRLHDTNHSGWWLLVPIIPLIFLLSDTKPETNKYGAPAR